MIVSYGGNRKKECGVENEGREKGKAAENGLSWKKNDFARACLLGSALLLSTAPFIKCGGGDNSSNDAYAESDATEGESEEPSACEKLEKARANLKVPSGWGYAERRCSSASGCTLGVNEGDSIVATVPGTGEKTLRIEKIESDKVIAKESETNSIEFMQGGSVYIEKDQQTFLSARLLGACTKGTCENGVSTDDTHATGKTILTLTVGEEKKRLMLSDGEHSTVQLGQQSIDVTLVKATESQAYIIYSISGTPVEGTELGAPVGQCGMLGDESLTISNSVSSDNAIVECLPLYVKLEIVDNSIGSEEPFVREFKKGDKIILGDKVEVVSNILAKLTGGLVDQNLSAAKLTDQNSGEEKVLYVSEKIETVAGSIKVTAIYVGNE